MTSSTVDVLPGAGMVCRQGEVSLWVGEDVGEELAARLISIVTADARMAGADVLAEVRHALNEVPPGAIGSLAAVAVSATGTAAVLHGAAVVQNGRGEAHSGALTTQVLHVDLPGDGLVGMWGAANPPTADSGAPGFDFQAGTVRGGGVVVRTVAVPGLAEPPVPPPAVRAVPAVELAPAGAGPFASLDANGGPLAEGEHPPAAPAPAAAASAAAPAAPAAGSGVEGRAEEAVGVPAAVAAPADPAPAEAAVEVPPAPSIVADADPTPATAMPVVARLAPDGAVEPPPVAPSPLAQPAVPPAPPVRPPAPPAGPRAGGPDVAPAPPDDAPEPDAGPPPDPALRNWEPVIPPSPEPEPAAPAAWGPPGRDAKADAWGSPETPGGFHPGANGTPEATPAAGPQSPPGQRSGGVRLLDLHARPAEERQPLSIVRDVVGEPAPVDEPRSVREVVQGIRCVNGHFNHQGMLYCRACGIGMVQQSAVLVEDERPSLGVIVMGDGSTFSLDDEYLLGRERSSDPAIRSIAVDDRRVSRRHAKLSLAGWDLQVTDLGSSNGTYVKNPGWAEWVRAMPHQPVTVEPGGQIGLGGQVLVYESSARRT